MDLNLQDWTVEAFLVKRDTRKCASEEEYLSVKKLNVNDNLKDKFKEIIKRYLCEGNNFCLSLDAFHEFMSDDINTKDYQVTKNELAGQNNYFNNLLGKLSAEEIELATNNYSDYYYTILKFSKEGQEIFYFRKLGRISVSAKKKFSIHQGDIEELEGDFIYFDDYIDFIFFKNFLVDGTTDNERQLYCDKILIYHRKNFKTLFRLNEYCINRSREFFDNFTFIDVADIDTDKTDSEGNILKLKETLVQNGSLNSQITRIFNKCGDEITFEKIKILKEQRGDKYSFNVEGEKIKIDDSNNLKDLLDLIDEKIATPDWSPAKLVRYPAKGDEV